MQAYWVVPWTPWKLTCESQGNQFNLYPLRGTFHATVHACVCGSGGGGGGSGGGGV